MKNELRVCVALLILLTAASGAWAQDVSFEPAVNYRAGGSPWSVAVGDFNGDGLQDLAVADPASNGERGASMSAILPCSCPWATSMAMAS